MGKDSNIGSLPDISVVVPVYNGANLIVDSARELSNFLEMHFPCHEILVVNDGSTDDTLRMLTEAKIEKVRCLTFVQNIGKGAAVRHGMLAARGRIRVFTDADLPYALDAIRRAYDTIVQSGAHMAVGDRTLSTSCSSARRSMVRELLSRVFRNCVSLLVIGGRYDTQCGIKAFRGDVASVLFELSKVNGFTFDVEVLFYALRAGLEVKKIPVDLVNEGNSSVRPVRDACIMFLEMLSIPLLWQFDNKTPQLLREKVRGLDAGVGEYE